MKSLWKSLTLVCALSGALAVAVTAGCGPQKAYCPNTSPKMNGVCPVEGDDAQAPPPADADTSCPAGQHFGLEPDRIHFGCIPN